MQEFGALTLIPIAGLAIGSAVLDACGKNGADVALGLGIGLVLLEGIGLTLAIRGAVGTPRVVLRPASTTIAITPWFGDRAGGLSLRATF